MQTPFTPFRNDLNPLSFNIEIWYICITLITHVPTHHYPNYSSQIFVLSLLNNSSSFLTSIKDRTCSYLIHTFKNTSMIAKQQLLCHLLYNVHTNTTQTPPSQLQKPAQYLFPNDHFTHPYYKTYPPSTHYAEHMFT